MSALIEAKDWKVVHARWFASELSACGDNDGALAKLIRTSFKFSGCRARDTSEIGGAAKATSPECVIGRRTSPYSRSEKPEKAIGAGEKEKTAEKAGIEMRETMYRQSDARKNTTRSRLAWPLATVMPELEPRFQK